MAIISMRTHMTKRGKATKSVRNARSRIITIKNNNNKNNNVVEEKAANG